MPAVTSSITNITRCYFHTFSILFPNYFRIISKLFPYYFHIISIVPALLVSVLFVSPLLPLPFPVIRSRFHAPIQFGLPLPFQSETFDAAAWMLQKVSISRVASSIISSVRSFADATQIPPIDYLEHYLMHCRPSCTVESLLMTCVSVIVMQLSFQYCPRAPWMLLECSLNATWMLLECYLHCWLEFQNDFNRNSNTIQLNTPMPTRSDLMLKYWIHCKWNRNRVSKSNINRNLMAFYCIAMWGFTINSSTSSRSSSSRSKSSSSSRSSITSNDTITRWWPLGRREVTGSTITSTKHGSWYWATSSPATPAPICVN